MPPFVVLVCAPGAAGEPTVREWVARHAVTGVICAAARTGRGTRIERDAGVTTVGDADPVWAVLVVEAEDDRAALAITASCPGAEPGTVRLYRLDLGDALGDLAADAATLR